MRKNIHRKPLIGQLEQGAIFNCCIAEEYANKEVYGIIITPRCDIHNDKVTTFHYLPMVLYKDWLRVDFWELFRKILKKNLAGSLGGMLKNKGKSPRVIDAFPIGDVKKEFSSLFKKGKSMFKNIHRSILIK